MFSIYAYYNVFYQILFSLLSHLIHNLEVVSRYIHFSYLKDSIAEFDNI